MNLLPKDHKDFSKKDYWNEFFSKQEHFEWYGEYDSLSDILNKYIHPNNKILVIGCGNSKLSADLYDVGFCNSINIDVSAKVISQMKEKYQKDRPIMAFEIMDVYELAHDDESFDVVIDKGTLDALLVDDSEEVSLKINRMFSQIERVLRNGGRYLCFSLLQEHVLQKLLDWFVDKGWFGRFHRCPDAEAKHENALVFPIYAVVLTKFKKLSKPPLFLEIVHHNTSTPKRCSSKNDVIEYVQSAQHFAFLKHYLNKRKVVDEDICLELCSSDTGQVKYKLFVVDRNAASTLKFAMFVVPQGRETEWLFSTPQGRQDLAASANCERLIVVHLLRDTKYFSLEEVEKDLSGEILDLAPASCKGKIPILSVGEDIGTRDIRCRGESKLSGEYVVEDVISDNNERFRKLIFLNSPYLIQSEAKLTKVPCKKKRKKGPPKLQIDFDYLACDHHVAIVSGLAFLNKNMFCPNTLLVGLGGGLLPMYLHMRFPEISMDVVELDSTVLEIAEKWFDLTTDERLRVHIKDGLAFIQTSVTKSLKYDVIIVDVDNKDASLGISGPPVAFLETSILTSLSQLLNDSGVLMINLACRNTELRKETYLRLKSVFKFMFSRKIPDEVNEIVYCIKSNDQNVTLAVVKDNYAKLVSFLENQTNYSDVFDLVDLDKCLKEIT